jgi:DNA-directed RNA polymerase specialized sigma24 family protein
MSAADARRWTLNAGAFERLLSALHPDRDCAAVEYEKLRERIAALLKWWGTLDSEALADETLDRVARKLDEGTTIAEGSFGAYVRGVARMVFYESGRRSRRESTGWSAAPRETAATDTDVHERLDACLTRLEAADRELVLRYYGAGKAADIRHKLALELGISPAALRIRVLRIRQRLEGTLSALADAT